MSQCTCIVIPSFWICMWSLYCMHMQFAVDTFPRMLALSSCTFVIKLSICTVLLLLCHYDILHICYSAHFCTVPYRHLPSVHLNLYSFRIHTHILQCVVATQCGETSHMCSRTQLSFKGSQKSSKTSLDIRDEILQKKPPI